MSAFEIWGGNELYGKVRLKSAKNAVLPILAACILSEEEKTVCDCPNISDVTAMIEILSGLGLSVKRVGADIAVCGSPSKKEIPKSLAGKMRSSVFLLGSLLAKSKCVTLPKPGGCNIGARPIDIHIAGLKALNVKITETDDCIVCDGEKMRAAQVVLKGVSVGATENMMTASVFLDGRTVIKNAAKEPEIVDLQNFLNAMGAKVSGAGTDVIEVVGVKKLGGVRYKPIPDRIVAGTVMCAVAACGGEVEIDGVNLPHVESIVRKLKQTACKFRDNCANIVVYSLNRPEAFSVQTGPYPCFPTDMQAQFMAVATIAKGDSVIRENLFETRFNHAAEFCKMGADVKVRGKTAFVQGVECLNGAEVECFDLRGGAATVIAALSAKGKSIVSGIEHVDRGYENLENTLASLGAVIKRT